MRTYWQIVPIDDGYNYVIKDGETHIFGVEENAVWYMEQNKERNPQFKKILNGILI